MRSSNLHLGANGSRAIYAQALGLVSGPFTIASPLVPGSINAHVPSIHCMSCIPESHCRPCHGLAPMGDLRSLTAGRPPDGLVRDPAGVTLLITTQVGGIELFRRGNAGPDPGTGLLSFGKGVGIALGALTVVEDNPWETDGGDMAGWVQTGAWEGAICFGRQGYEEIMLSSTITFEWSLHLYCHHLRYHIICSEAGDPEFSPH